MLLVLDLDETLIHSTRFPLVPGAWRAGAYFVNPRPHLPEFLRGVKSQGWRLGVWTAGTPDYAELVIAGIEEHTGLELNFEFVFARDRCTPRRDSDGQHYWLKDLKKVVRLGHSLERILVFDNEPRGLERQRANLLRADTWLGNPSDVHLLEVLPLLADRVGLPRIRQV